MYLAQEMDSKRVLGLDFGTKTVGVAVSDGLGLTAQGVEIIRREQPNKLRRTLARIEELCDQYEVGSIVLGLPLNMDDTEGARCEATRAFAADVERRTGRPVIFIDERLTTVDAIDAMNEMGIAVHERKKYVDEIAAMLILQDYLNNPERNTGK